MSETVERPTFSECVIGYRSWKLDDWVLSPVSYGHPWRPGVNRATCKAGDTWGTGFTFTWTTGGFITAPTDEPAGHSAPQQDCTCGIHAYHDIPTNAEGIVVGAVAAWGDLQVHCNGFRAEYAQIVALVEAPNLGEVAELYGVPLVPRNMLEVEASQHGTPLPESMRPPKPEPVAVEETFWTSSLTNSLVYGSAFLYGSSPYMQVSGSGYTRGGSYTFPTITPPPRKPMPSPWQIAANSFLDNIDFKSITDEASDLDKSVAKALRSTYVRQGPQRPQRPPKNLGGKRTQ